MLFFHNLIQSWVFWGVVSWLIVFFTPIRRFLSDDGADCPKWINRVLVFLDPNETGNPLLDFFLFIWLIFLVVFFMVISIVIAPYLLLHFQLLDAERESQKVRIEKWKKENLPNLRYKTFQGVTVVLRLDDFLKIEEVTRRARIDGLWPEVGPFMLSQGSFLFFHQSFISAATNPGTGKDSDELKKWWKGIEPLKSGRPSDFEDLKSVARLVESQDIFVPFTSPLLIDPAKQLSILELGLSHYDRQAPKRYLLQNNPPKWVIDGTDDPSI